MMKGILILLVLSSISFLMGVAEFTPLVREWDLGRIYEKDGVVQYIFKFTNTGDEPLLLLDVHAS